MIGICSSGKPTTVTRQSLYDEIWRTSMRAVARKLGVSAGRLAKICDHFQIPYPQGPHIPRDVPPPPLPAVPTSAADTITITSSEARLRPDTLPSALTGENQNGDEKGPYHPQLNSWLRKHLAWRQGLLRSSHVDAGGDEVSPNIRRRLQISNLVFNAAQRKGLVPKIAEDRRLRFFDFLYEGVPIKCELRETKKQVPHGRGGRTYQRTEYLLFRITNVSSRDLHTKIEWHEKSVGPLQKQVDGIVAGLMLAGPVVVRAEGDRAARQRQWEAQQLQARRRELAVKHETSLRQALYRAAEDYRTARNLGELIQDLERANHDPKSIVGEHSISDWLAWAKAQRDRLDPVSQGTSSFFEAINAVLKPTS